MVVAKEQRKEERFIARDMSKGELYCPGSGQYFKVESVHDVSSKGIGLQVNACLQQGEKVRLGLKRGRAHIHIYGYVVWCSPVGDASPDDKESGSFRVGINL
jgi:hypothetical protein